MLMQLQVAPFKGGNSNTLSRVYPWQPRVTLRVPARPVHSGAAVLPATGETDWSTGNGLVNFNHLAPQLMFDAENPEEAPWGYQSHRERSCGVLGHNLRCLNRGTANELRGGIMGDSGRRPCTLLYGQL